MKSTKTTGKRRAPAKRAISRAALGAAWDRIAEIFKTPNGDRWMTLLSAVIDQRADEARHRDDEMLAATGLGDGFGTAQLFCVLGEILALRRFSSAELFELGSSEEALLLCREAFARGLREPTGDGGQVIRFHRSPWIADPTPREEPPNVEPEP